MLPAYVEIMLAADDRGARDACHELEAIAEADDDGALGAIAAQARARGPAGGRRARRALPRFAVPAQAWQGSTRRTSGPNAVLMAPGCRALGDEDSAALELEAARAGFERWAAPDLDRLERLAPPGAGAAHGLTERELEVLRHVAAGATNKAIATELVLSVRTIDRHVSNIFTKLGVSTRARPPRRAHELTCSERRWVKSPMLRGQRLGGFADARPARRAYGRTP